MPFVSSKQRKWMHANEPEMAMRWEHEPRFKTKKKKKRKSNKALEGLKKAKP